MWNYKLYIIIFSKLTYWWTFSKLSLNSYVGAVANFLLTIVYPLKDAIFANCFRWQFQSNPDTRSVVSEIELKMSHSSRSPIWWNNCLLLLWISHCSRTMRIQSSLQCFWWVQPGTLQRLLSGEIGHYDALSEFASRLMIPGILIKRVLEIKI